MVECISIMQYQEIQRPVQRLLRQSDRIGQRTLNSINRRHRSCAAFLNEFPPSEHKTSLLKLLDFIRHRDF